MSRRKLAQVLAGRLPAAGSNEFAAELAAYLLKERRVSELGSLLRDIEQARADEGGIVEAIAVTAHPLTSSARAHIETELKLLYPHARRIMITERIDETQLGGVRLELANQQLDLSIRSKLNRFKQLTAVEN